jgi:hypothetical protein
MLKISKIISSKSKNIVKENSGYLRIFHLNISNFNKLFNGHVLKWSRYYNSANLTNNLVENMVIFWINTNWGILYGGPRGKDKQNGAILLVKSHKLDLSPLKRS